MDLYVESEENVLHVSILDLFYYLFIWNARISPGWAIKNMYDYKGHRLHTRLFIWIIFCYLLASCGS